MHTMPHSAILPCNGKTPEIGQGSFLASGAYVIGDVIAGTDCSFWFNTAVRGDCNWIRIGDRTNVQDGSVIHVTQGTGPTTIGSDVTIGHNATIHACTIADECLIGMGAVVLDGANIAKHCFVAAGAIVTPNKTFEPGSFIVGSPARAKRPLTAEEIADIQESSKRYLEYKKPYMES